MRIERQVLATVLMVLGSVGALATWPGVLWEQIALAAGTVDSDVAGLWFAAFGDGIVFVIVGGREVSQAVLAVRSVAHLAMPVLVLFGAALWVVTCVRAARSNAGATDR